MNCRHCGAALTQQVIDLGHQPASNAYLTAAQLEGTEGYAPLKVYVCHQCWLVQIPSFHASHELFTADYAYFSSVSQSWLDHAQAYVATVTERFGLTSDDWVVEVASNDGYLLQYVAARGITCTGIEPTASTAAAARARGIESIERFFGADLAQELVASRGHASLTAANNVLAHVPDINDFVAGFAVLLAPEGAATFEFPHLVNLIDGCQFDTIYHEHYSYLSLTTVEKIFAAQGLRVFDVEEVPTHGGSLRVYACHADAAHEANPAVAAMLAREEKAGVTNPAWYAGLAAEAERIKLDLLDFLITARRAGKRVAAYGAAAKGNTLLNYAGVRADLVDFVCDAAPSKQGRFLPGSHVPILPPSALAERKPDYVLILPWNLTAEITAAQAQVHDWGGKFVVAVPALTFL
ncbi:class I SAM-dependent methyltransferase [Novosphingobium sp.]|uniref:class I SAM-dependent methyltransferase n=1 Tax=Novosphingobium sp. TaxID=1874826 RepID=UPI00286BB45B|nr:class I SAM-dependent methyltransferase [Novosphingobium sp.]